jgi:hypothetical protein
VHGFVTAVGVEVHAVRAMYITDNVELCAYRSDQHTMTLTHLRGWSDTTKHNHVWPRCYRVRAVATALPLERQVLEVLVQCACMLFSCPVCHPKVWHHLQRFHGRLEAPDHATHHQ